MDNVGLQFIELLNQNINKSLYFWQAVFIINLVSNFVKKSELNRLASASLYDAKLYPASIHTAYYTVVQLSVDRVVYFMYRDHNHFEIESNNTSFHTFIIKKITELYKQRGAKTWQRMDFDSNLKKLRALRVLSDYGNHVPSKNDSDEALDLMKKILYILENVLSYK